MNGKQVRADLVHIGEAYDLEAIVFRREPQLYAAILALDQPLVAQSLSSGYILDAPGMLRAPLAGKADWEATMALSNALGYPMTYKHPSEIMDEIASLTPTFAGVSFARIEELGSIQWPCNDAAPTGTPTMHIDRFVRGKGKFVVTEFVATEERVGPRFPLLLTTGRILSQYNVGA